MTPKSLPFTQGFKAKFGNFPSYAGYTSYDEVYYLADAFKRAGSAIYTVGIPDIHLGGSVYAELLGIEGALVPRLDYDDIERANAFVLAAFREGLIAAAHDVSDGGTLVALAKMAFATHDGARIGVAMAAGARDGIACDDAFAEATGFVIEVADEEAFAMLAFARDVVVERIATTTGAYTFTFADESRASLDDLYEIWSAPLRDFYAPARQPEGAGGGPASAAPVAAPRVCGRSMRTCCPAVSRMRIACARAPSRRTTRRWMP